MTETEKEIVKVYAALSGLFFVMDQGQDTARSLRRDSTLLLLLLTKKIFFNVMTSNEGNPCFTRKNFFSHFYCHF